MGKRPRKVPQMSRNHSKELLVSEMSRNIDKYINQVIKERKKLDEREDETIWEPIGCFVLRFVISPFFIMFTLVLSSYCVGSVWIWLVNGGPHMEEVVVPFPALLSGLFAGVSLAFVVTFWTI